MANDDLDISIPGRRAPQPSGQWAVWRTASAGCGFARFGNSVPKWDTEGEAQATADFWNSAAPAWAGQYYEAKPWTSGGFARWGVQCLNLITGEARWATMAGVPVVTNEADARAKADLWTTNGPPKDTVYQAKELAP